ncbi:laminin-like protein lam-2 isoform X2 [Tachypleus tridentatus]|uniref:laminin-like protein lam-2 isoform X2 n=1 Tax=Tachypleus tridentatus TaxID=6853 RepID=UPI003FD580FF
MSTSRRNFFLFLYCIYVFRFWMSYGQVQILSSGECYNKKGKALRCIPDFENLAYNRDPWSTSTCGRDRITEYCSQTETKSDGTSCTICTKNDHPTKYLTDFNDKDKETWWQSETLYEGIRQVNIILHLGKSCEISYVRLKFRSSRPESFALYKRISENSEWIPFQFFSSSCQTTYGIPPDSYVTKENETKPLCTSAFSGISPLIGGNVAFSTLEDRPGAYDFENNAPLQDWVTATDIRISLDKMNTFGDEIFGNDKVLKTYYFAITDLAVGGRCKCNGHAKKCISLGNSLSRSCLCEHNTTGPDCDRCLPFYQDKPWGQATSQNANECKACNCNGRSFTCYFDLGLYKKTGHGGHCTNCQGNTEGPHCERCKDNFFMKDGQCIPCLCDLRGAVQTRCKENGQCICKPGVKGLRCDICEDNLYEFASDGCRRISGALQKDKEFIHLPCFCFGHSSVCERATGYVKYVIASSFNTDRYLGDQRASYNQTLSFTLKTEGKTLAASADDLILESGNTKIAVSITEQNNSLPTTMEKSFTFKLNEQPVFGWKPQLDVYKFLTILSNLTALKIRANFNPKGKTYLYDVRLESARLSIKGENASWVENCSCPLSYTGQFCESCSQGYTRNISGGGKFDSCIPCDCSGVSNDCHGETGSACDICAQGYYDDPSHPKKQCEKCQCNGNSDPSALRECDIETGECLKCIHNTAGWNCDKCLPSHYGDALAKPKSTCTSCPPCYKVIEEVVISIKDIITEMAQSLKHIEENRWNITDYTFEDILSELNKNISDLLQQARNVSDQELIIPDKLREVKVTFSNVQKIVRQITLKTQEAKEKCKLGKQIISSAEENIEDIFNVLLNIDEYLRKEGFESLINARDRVEMFGKQSERMKEIAEEAKQLSDGHEKEAQLLEDKAAKAVSILKIAYVRVQQLLQAQDEILYETEKLQNTAYETEQLLSRTTSEAGSSADTSNRAYSEALALMSHGRNIVVPNKNYTATRDWAFRILHEANITSENTEKLTQMGLRLFDEMIGQKVTAEDILKEAVLLNKGMDELLSDAKTALNKAKDAVRFEENVLSNATEKLKTLKEFDRIVQESRNKAVNALETFVPLIHELLNKANEKTTHARNAVHQAETDTIDSKKKASESAIISLQISQEVDDLRMEAEGMKQDSRKELEESHKIFEGVQKAFDHMKIFEEKTESESELAEKILILTDDLQNSMKHASSKAENARNVLQNLMNKIDNLDSLNQHDLDEIGEEIKKAEDEDNILTKKIDELRIIKRNNRN